MKNNLGTRGRARTGTAFRPRDFKSLVSTIPPRGPRWGDHSDCLQKVKATETKIRKFHT